MKTGLSADGFAATETTMGGGAASGLAAGGIRKEIDFPLHNKRASEAHE